MLPFSKPCYLVQIDTRVSEKMILCHITPGFYLKCYILIILINMWLWGVIKLQINQIINDLFQEIPINYKYLYIRYIHNIITPVTIIVNI